MYTNFFCKSPGSTEQSVERSGSFPDAAPVQHVHIGGGSRERGAEQPGAAHLPHEVDEGTAGQPFVQP